MKKLCTVFIFALFLTMPSAVFASHWFVCLVTADLEKAEEDGLYRITPRHAAITDGFGEKGAPCLEHLIGETVTAPLEGDEVETGTYRRLIYRYFSAQSPDGVVTEETWTATGWR